eukprot:CAMPEP_0172733810 /NCGR_PEP_ID=MMETSP1074-20121228/108174_1 /TAXON_ID=2916 /ORGANISM="Ceratium fusus, Strain PA161109" /LENGTH=47 /DNA_ID= /DNA_START= /DNA_END= /DNA_ORIENTATION=
MATPPPWGTAVDSGFTCPALDSTSNSCRMASSADRVFSLNRTKYAAD